MLNLNKRVSKFDNVEFREQDQIIHSQAAPFAGAAPRPGAPPLDCNTWLYKQMCVLPDPRACSHLRPHWQGLFLEEMGVAPENWEKSFRAAARYCLCRILRERGEVGREPAGDQQGDQFRNESGETQDGRSPA